MQYVVVLFLLSNPSVSTAHFDHQEFYGQTPEQARKRCIRAGTVLKLAFTRIDWACVAKDFDDE